MAYTTINKSSLHMNPKLYTGNGGTQSIDVGFQSDWTWLKSRTEAKNHVLIDAVRGSSKNIHSNLTNAEDTNATRITGFDSDGFNLGSSSTTNTNSQNYVSWNWKANGQGSSNTDGSINTTYTSVNTTAGFSIVTYTGTGANATVGHGLGVAPRFIISKRLDSGSAWFAYSEAIPNMNTGFMTFSETGAFTVNSTNWNNTSPTSSVISIGTSPSINASGGRFVLYCFAEKQGFSKFSSYTGNGDSDGTFVSIGFKPAWILIKRTDASSNWEIYDSKRLGFNDDNPALYTDTNDAEGGNGRIDILSNGFKIRTTSGNLGASGGTYIYMAFAEAPLVGSNNVPANAR